MLSVYQAIFDRACSPVGKILVGTVIGAIAVAIGGHEERGSGSYSIPVLAAVGAGMGFVAAMILLLVDRVGTSTLGMVCVSVVTLVLVVGGIFGFHWFAMTALKGR